MVEAHLFPGWRVWCGEALTFKASKAISSRQVPELRTQSLHRQYEGLLGHAVQTFQDSMASPMYVP